MWILESFLINEVDLNLASVTVAAIYTSLFNALFVMCLTHMADEKSFKATFEFKEVFSFFKDVGVDEISDVNSIHDFVRWINQLIN
ncbi:MAG: hypothetical protein QM405_08100 [Euryarchaeota archaeon]|nr:hypothetical protein [Euryarchaeota archaeon]